jgi:tetratricopeptide (TPR) repeat protein
MVRETPKGEAHVHADPPPVSIQEIERLQAEADARPSDAPALLRLANILHDNAMRDSRFLLRAIETYKKYLNLQPANPDARVDLGICYFELGRVDSINNRSLFSQAIREMETAFRSSPTHQPAAFNLGIVNLNAGNLEESNKWMKKTVELNQQSELGQRAQRILEQHSFQ